MIQHYISFGLLITLFSGVGQAAARQMQQPTLFQVTTSETRPGETVMVRGEGLQQVDRVAISQLPDNLPAAAPGYLPRPHEDHLPDHVTGQKIPAVDGQDVRTVQPLQQNNQSLKFIVPKDWTAGVYSVRLMTSGAKALTFYVNQPMINWVISEEGQKAIAGDYLRIQGKNLLREGKDGQAVLVPQGKGKPVSLRPEKVFDDYSVRFGVPENTPLGCYKLYYHNGYGGPSAWSEPLTVQVIAKPVDTVLSRRFNVRDYGALGNGEHNETAAFRAALDAAGRNGGGTVYVPPGRYLLTDGLIIEPHTVLEGESAERTQLFWSPQNWDTNEMPASLLCGTHHFGIRKLNIWATRAWGIIMQTGPSEERGHVTLEDLVVRQSYQIGGFMYMLKGNRDTAEAEFNSRWHNTGIILKGENIKVRHCDFNSVGMYSFGAASGFIQQCRFTRHNTGINQPYLTIDPRGLIFEDCIRQADGFGYAATIYESNNLYEARNVTPYDYTNDRESMTLDGGSGGYFGPVVGAERNIVVLSSAGRRNEWLPDKWIGGGVFILSGKGAGQFRRIVQHGIDTVRLDEPFLVQPDSTSTISITTVRQNLFFVNNEVSDAGAYQFYGSISNAVISGLKLRRCNGIVSRGAQLYGGNQPNWYIDIVNCELHEGNYSHWLGIDDRGHSGHQSINLIGTGGAGMNLGALVRRNRLSDFSYIRTSPGLGNEAVVDLVIEGNSFNLADSAIVLGGTGNSTSRVLIHNNAYKEVNKRLSVSPALDKSAYLMMDARE